MIARAAVLAIALTVTLTGCVTNTPIQGDNTMDHVEAKAQLETLLEIAQDAIGGEWDRSDTGARDCNGGEGASYLLTRRGPAVDEAAQQAVVDGIVAQWRDNDVDAVVTTKPEVNDVVVTQLRFPEGGTVDDGFFIEVWISDRASSVTGQTRCATGDAAEINAD